MSAIGCMTTSDGGKECLDFYFGFVFIACFLDLRALKLSTRTGYASRCQQSLVNMQKANPRRRGEG